MQRMFLAGAMLIGLLACGSEPMGLSAIVRVDAQLQSQTAGLVVWVVGPEMSNGVLLTCPALQLENIFPSDKKVKMLGRKEVDPNSAGMVEMSSIEAGKGRIVYVTAQDLSGARIGYGCVEGVEVPSGGAVEVEVRVYAAQ